MPRPMSDRFAAALVGRGERLVKQTGRYDVYSRAQGGFYYIGSRGALRVGKTVAASHPVSDAVKEALLREGT